MEFGEIGSGIVLGRIMVMLGNTEEIHSLRAEGILVILRRRISRVILVAILII
jgi:hypothetical protein